MFNIPIYQRNFSWSTDEFDLIFEDIKDSKELDQKQYFLGSILLQETKEEKLYEVVDGQQRLTALSLLIAVIRDSITNEELKNEIHECLYQKPKLLDDTDAIMRITPWKDLLDLFEDYLYVLNGTNQFLNDYKNHKISFRDTEDPVYHFYEGIKTFKSKINEMEDVIGFLNYLRKNVYMVYIITNSFESAYRLFNVLNARGVPLSTYDLLKSENLGEIQNENKRESQALKLRNIEKTLGLKELDNVIGHIRTITTQEKAKTNIYEEYRILFQKGILKRGTKFIDYLNNISNIYQNKILEPILESESSEANKYKITVNLMNRYIPFSDWIPPLLAFYNNKCNSEEDLFKFTSILEKKVLVEWMAGFSYTERITSLNKLLKLIESSNNSEYILENLLYFKSKDSRGKKARTVNFNDENAIKEIIESKLNDNQFYSIFSGKLARYTLLKLDSQLWELDNFPGYPGMITVEHILPQNPSNDSNWVNSFTIEDREEWTNKLGNLVLLSGRKNSKARNFDFETKKNAYFKNKDTPFQITQKIRVYDKWMLKDLKNRHQRLVNEFTALILDY